MAVQFQIYFLWRPPNSRIILSIYPQSNANIDPSFCNSPEESLAGEAAVTAVVDVSHRAVATYSTQNFGHRVCVSRARGGGASWPGGHLGLLARLWLWELSVFSHVNLWSPTLELAPWRESFLDLWRSVFLLSGGLKQNTIVNYLSLYSF